MKAKTYLLLFIALSGSQMLCAQEDVKWQVDVSSGLSLAITNAQQIDKLNLGRFNQDLSGFEKESKNDLAISDFSLMLNGNYKLNTFLTIGAGFEFVGLQGAGESISDRNESKAQRYHLNLKLDALFKNPYEELNLIVGGHFANLNNRTYSAALSQDFTTKEYNVLGFTRTMRQLRHFSFNLGLEWRDYITPHFGYFLQFSYNPMVRTTTHSLLFERVVLNGETHPVEGKRITPGKDGYPLETYTFKFVNFNLGLTCQW